MIKKVKVGPSAIDALFHKTEEYARMAGRIPEADVLRSLLVAGNRMATQDKVQAHYWFRLSVDQRKRGNVVLLVFGLYAEDWKNLLERLGILSTPYQSSGPFAQDWGAGNRSVL